MNWYKKSQNQIRLWLDDERNPRSPIIQEKFGSSGDEIWVKTPQEAISYLKRGNVSFISFDHDLGGELKGLEVANWIEEKAYNKELDRIEWRVHSQNPIGNADIVRAMESSDRFWEDTNKDATSNSEIKLSQDYQIYSIQDSIQNREDIVPSLLRKQKDPRLTNTKKPIKKKKKIKIAENMNEPKRTIKITQADYDKVKSIVEKISSGNQNWSPEELQDQANYPEVIEILLRRKKNELV